MAFGGIKSSGSMSGMGSFQRSVPTTLSEINVTPLVDVMLVLLIVFMISAPLMQQGIQVNLPKTKSGGLSEAPEQLVLAIDKNRQVFIADRAIPSGTLQKRLIAIASSKPEIEVVIQADQALNYGFLAQVMSEVKRAGIQKVGLLTQPGESTSQL